VSSWIADTEGDPDLPDINPKIKCNYYTGMLRTILQVRKRAAVLSGGLVFLPGPLSKKPRKRFIQRAVSGLLPGRRVLKIPGGDIRQ
jgi:hypothetical protein